MLLIGLTGLTMFSKMTAPSQNDLFGAGAILNNKSQVCAKNVCKLIFPVNNPVTLKRSIRTLLVYCFVYFYENVSASKLRNF